MRQAERDASFGEYVLLRQARLRRVAFGLCGDWHQSEDLVQTAFTKLYVQWPRLRRAGGEDAYARRVLVNAYIDESRRPWRREAPGLEGFELGATEAADVAEQRDELVSVLRQLPLMQRKVIVLRHLADLSVEETAADLGISTGTVKSHTSRGIARLQELLRTPLTKEN
jgi:RNA polymerase sigma-70 factor (sigma-E family)